VRCKTRFKKEGDVDLGNGIARVSPSQRFSCFQKWIRLFYFVYGLSWIADVLIKLSADVRPRPYQVDVRKAICRFKGKNESRLC